MRPVRANRIRDEQCLHHVVRLASKSGQIEKYVLVMNGVKLNLLLNVLDPERFSVTFGARTNPRRLTDAEPWPSA
jgi:hypothetical protein